MCSAGTCADGFPLGHLTSFGLKPAINAVFEKLYSLTKNNPDSMVLQQLLNSETTPWPQVKALWQKEQHNNTKKHLLKHAFLHAIMQQLDLHCWGPHGEHLTIFTQKHQVTPGLPAIAAVSWWSMHTCSQLADAVQLQGLLAAQHCELYLGMGWLQIRAGFAKLLDADPSIDEDSPQLMQTNEDLDLYTKVGFWAICKVHHVQMVTLACICGKL